MPVSASAGVKWIETAFPLWTPKPDNETRDFSVIW